MSRRYGIATVKLGNGEKWIYIFSALVAIFASLVVLDFLAADRCLDGGGRVADWGWACETASGSIKPFQSLLTWPMATAALVIGIFVFCVLVWLGARLFLGRSENRSLRDSN